MRRVLSTLALAIAGTLCFGQLPEKGALLDAVLDANLKLKCKGMRVITFRFERDGKQTIKRVKEYVVMDGEKIRTEFASDEMKGQIAVDDGRFRFHYFPKDNVIHRSPSWQHQNTSRLEVLVNDRRKDYEIAVAEGGTIYRMPTYLITMKNPKGFSHKIWVEKRGKAILKREFQGPDANRGTSYEYESFEYRRRIDSDEFKIEKPGVTVLDPTDRLALAAKKVEYAPYVISDARFKLYEVGTFEATEAKIKVLRSTYGDGKTVVTLHQFRGAMDTSRWGGREPGRMLTRAWREGGYNFVLVGDLTASELERLAGLLRR
jgi:outer membrane lipoprotein-sorting protein